MKTNHQFKSWYALYLLIPILLFSYQNKKDHATTELSSYLEPTLVASGVEHSFLVLSDVHLDYDATTITPDGSQWTDTDRKLWEYTQDKISEVLADKDSLKIEFMVFTGDLPVHSHDSLTRSFNIGKVLDYLSELSDTSGIPLLFAPGNNDALTKDYGSFRDALDHPPFITDVSHSGQWPYVGNKGLCDGTGNSQCYIDSSQVYGYFSAYPLPNRNLRFIGLNTVINNNSGSHCYNPPADGIDQALAAKEQMQWFTTQMDSAAAKQEKILIAMHIPPGLDGYSGNKMWPDFTTDQGITIQDQFITLINKYEKNVVGILTGHTHYDEVRVIYKNKKESSDICISTPGITPQHANNPGFKLFTYDSSNYELMNFTTHWANFFQDSTVVKFDSSYTFNEVYQNSSGLPMSEWISQLVDQNEFDRIEDAMTYTYKVGQDLPLSAKTKKAMKMYITHATPIDTSLCR